MVPICPPCNHGWPAGPPGARGRRPLRVCAGHGVCQPRHAVARGAAARGCQLAGGGGHAAAGCVAELVAGLFVRLAACSAPALFAEHWRITYARSRTAGNGAEAELWEGPSARASASGSVDTSLMSADELAEYEEKKLKLRKARGKEGACRASTRAAWEH